MTRLWLQSQSCPRFAVEVVVGDKVGIGEPLASHAPHHRTYLVDGVLLPDIIAITI